MLYLKEKRMKKNNGKLSQKCESSMEGNPPPVDIHAVFYVAIDSTSLSFYWLLNIKKYQNELYVIYSNDLLPASRIHIKPSPFFLVFHFHSSSVHLFIIIKSLIQIVISCYKLSFHSPICSNLNIWSSWKNICMEIVSVAGPILFSPCHVVLKWDDFRHC